MDKRKNNGGVREGAGRPKPKESVDITSSDGFNINFKDIIKFKDWEY